MQINQFSILELMGALNSVETKNAPERLYTVGDVQLLRMGKRVSLVGSRKATENGLRRAEKLTRKLAEHGIIIVSGLAEGIDTVAHQTAINLHIPTVAVLGNAVDQFYPAKNRKLQEAIMNDYLVVSQFPVGYPAKRENYPQRNRVMALLSDATVIVEAQDKSGSLHQGWEALRLGRPLYILESSVNDSSLSWPKELLKYGAEILSDRNFLDLISSLPEGSREERAEVTF
jgi:DNA processing protein